MLRFTLNDDAYSQYKDEFWFELAILNRYGNLNDDLKKQFCTIPPVALNQMYAEMANIRMAMNNHLSPENRLSLISSLRTRVSEQALIESGQDTFDNLLDDLNLHVFSRDPLSLFLYLSHPDTKAYSFQLPELMNKSLGHCHAVISVGRFFDPILNGPNAYLHNDPNAEGRSWRDSFVPGIISADFYSILTNINPTSYEHLLRVDKTRKKLEEIYNKFPVEITGYMGGWREELVQKAFAPRSDMDYAYR